MHKVILSKSILYLDQLTEPSNAYLQAIVEPHIFSGQFTQYSWDVSSCFSPMNDECAGFFSETAILMITPFYPTCSQIDHTLSNIVEVVLALFSYPNVIFFRLYKSINKYLSCHFRMFVSVNKWRENYPFDGTRDVVTIAATTCQLRRTTPLSAQTPILESQDFCSMMSQSTYMLEFNSFFSLLSFQHQTKQRHSKSSSSDEYNYKFGIVDI